MKQLKVLCPQLYVGNTMHVVACNRCRQWNHERELCSVTTGAEHLPDVPPELAPGCPIQDRCMHQLQAVGPCPVRSKGLVCESALVFGGMSRDDAMSDARSFHVDVVAPPEEIAEHMAANGASPDEVAAYLARWEG